jgi:DNA-binding NtrC family response regulator
MISFLFQHGTYVAPNHSMPGSPIVLVVDDESDLAESLARLLRRHGYLVVMANTYAAGHAALSEASPALLVSDVRLPDGDGLALVRAAGARQPRVPAIVISGYLSEASQMAARDAGAAAFLAKPFSNDVFARAVEQALAGRDGHDR